MESWGRGANYDFLNGLLPFLLSSYRLRAVLHIAEPNQAL